MRVIVFLFMSVTAGAATLATVDQAAQAAPGRAQTTNRWRYLWHNDRWWYWTFDERWSYFDGRRWVNYDPRRAPSGALGAAYRKAPAFEKPPATTPSPPGSWLAPTLQSEAALTMPFNSDLDAAASRVGGDFAESRLPRAGTAAENRRGRGGLPKWRTPRAGGIPTGGGGFGGPRGTSLGAGSAAGGASSPQ